MNTMAVTPSGITTEVSSWQPKKARSLMMVVPCGMMAMPFCIGNYVMIVKTVYFCIFFVNNWFSVVFYL